MRCLHCHHEGVLLKAELCPNCGVYLPSLLRDVLPSQTRLRSNTYALDHALGRGSFGITYLARHETLDYSVAIKEFFPQDYATRHEETGELIIPINKKEIFQRGLQRFLQEGQLLVQLNHPNVVRVQDLFEDNNTAYMVMNYIEGITLALELESQQGKKLLPQRIERLMAQLVEAVHRVHEAGFYHLDIKPENILITPNESLILVDFGSAKQTRTHNINSTRFFTEAYAAPEIMVGGEVGRESDIFELGMILYEMLTGELPPPALTRLVEGDHWTPEGLDQPWFSLVTAALQLKREQRPGNAQQWWQGRHQSHPIVYIASPPKKPSRPLAMTLRGHFVLPSLKEQGMQQQFGRGAIKSIFPLSEELVVVCAAGSTSLFHLQQGEVLWEIDCPADHGCLSPEGSYLALVWQQQIYLWNLETGRLQTQLEGHFKPITAIAFSPDGNLLVSGSRDETIIIWDLKSGKPIHHLHGHQWFITSLAVSPNGKIIASGSRDHTVRLWDIDSGEAIRVLENHTDGVECVAFSPDSQLVASGSRDHTIQLWNINTGNILHCFQGHRDWITAITFSPDGHLIASAGGIEDKTVCLWDLSSGEEIWPLQDHWNTVKAIAFCPQGNYLISGSDDYTLRLWDLINSVAIKCLKKHTNWLYCLAFSSDDRLIATGGSDHLIHLWDTVQNQNILDLVGHTDAVSSLAFSSDGKFLVSGSWDQTLRLWEMPSGKQLRFLQGHEDWIRGVAFSPNRRFIASASWDGTVRVWDLTSSWLPLTGGKGVRIFTGHSQEVECVTFSPDSCMIASGSLDQTVRLWEVSSGQELHKLEDHSAGIQCLAFSPNGQFIVSGGRDHLLRLWDVRSGQGIQKIKGHTDKINSVAFSPDGKFIVSGSHDQTVRLWEPLSGELMQVWQGHTHWVKTVVFNAKGTFIASADNAGVVRVWRVF